MMLNCRRKGLSLIEVVLTVGLLVPVMGTMFWFYSSTMETRDRNGEMVRETQLARVIVDRIAKELRQSTGFAGGYGPGIFGTRNRISINTVVIPDKALLRKQSISETNRPGQFDLRQVDYYIAWDEINTDENGDPRALGLVRRERRTFNQLAPVAEAGEVPLDDPNALSGDPGGQPSDAPSRDGFGLGDDPTADEDQPFDPTGGDTLGERGDDELNDIELEGAKQELYAPELRFIEFFYHDGNKWWESWEIKEGNSLPQMVMITVGYEPELPDDMEIEIIEEMFINEEDIEPLAEDRYMVIVRIPQADSFFGSRVQREVSSLADFDF